jgi:hypothetical protein
MSIHLACELTAKYLLISRKPFPTASIQKPDFYFVQLFMHCFRDFNVGANFPQGPTACAVPPGTISHRHLKIKKLSISFHNDTLSFIS